MLNISWMHRVQKKEQRANRSVPRATPNRSSPFRARQKGGGNDRSVVALFLLQRCDDASGHSSFLLNASIELIGSNQSISCGDKGEKGGPRKKAPELGNRIRHPRAPSFSAPPPSFRPQKTSTSTPLQTKKQVDNPSNHGPPPQPLPPRRGAPPRLFDPLRHPLLRFQREGGQFQHPPADRRRRMAPRPRDIFWGEPRARRDV